MNTIIPYFPFFSHVIFHRQFFSRNFRHFVKPFARASQAVRELLSLSLRPPCLRTITRTHSKLDEMTRKKNDDISERAARASWQRGRRPSSLLIPISISKYVIKQLLNITPEEINICSWALAATLFVLFIFYFCIEERRRSTSSYPCCYASEFFFTARCTSSSRKPYQLNVQRANFGTVRVFTREAEVRARCPRLKMYGWTLIRR